MPEPDKFYTQHHAVEAPVIDDSEFRPYWRRCTHLDALLHDRAITIVEWRAGQAFRSIAETVLSANWNISQWMDNSRSRRGFDINLGGRHDAINRLHKLHNALGSFAIDLLEVHIVDDISWTELGRRLGVHAKTARSHTILALRALAAVIWA